MATLAIRNIGPIKLGLGEQVFDFNGLTLLTGAQGTGKSTVAKLYSALTWLEKALVRGELSPENIAKPHALMEEVLSFHNLESYFSSDSYFKYKGERFSFAFENSALMIKELEDNAFSSPKIMYVPAERNFLTVLSNPEFIDKLPESLKVFLAEYFEARESSLGAKPSIALNDAAFVYDKEASQSFVQGNGFKIKLQNASSGLQSYFPMVLVTEYLAKSIFDPDFQQANSLSVASRVNLSRRLKALFSSTSGLSAAETMQQAQQLAESYVYKCFINIVEEPEQNLYPTSQKLAIFALLKAMNSHPNNRLLITTHSPFVISYINLSLLAHKIYERADKAQKSANIQDICPRDSAVCADRLTVYEFQTTGEVKRLSIDDGLISDDNQLNDELQLLNEYFANLIDWG